MIGAITAVPALAATRFANHVLRDYPRATRRLAAHAGRIIAVTIGPAFTETRLRITTAGDLEPVGRGAEAPADVSLAISPRLLPRLAAGDETAYGEVVFTGNGELASLLSELARGLEWDVEEDLSRLVGDVAAHRVVDTLRRGHAWREDVATRLVENVAEYLTEERRAFVVARDLETFACDNEALRDDLARLEARLRLLTPTESDTGVRE